jgi:hypothetical protein
MFGLLGARLLRTRYGIAVVLAVVVLAVVGIARLAAPGERPAGGIRVDATADVPSPVDPTAGDDGEVTPPPAENPVTSPGAAAPETVAMSFASAWLDHRGVDGPAWLARLRPFATAGLVEDLTDVDPVGVPADRITGTLQLIPRSSSLVEVTLPVDSGELRLRLLAENGRWLVDGVDWERA